MATVPAYVLEVGGEYTKFDKEAIKLCSSIMSNASKNKVYAIALRQNWERNGIIECDATYEEVSTKTILMKTLLKYLGQGLSDDVTKSNYGLSILSDHNLYFNCSTDSKLNVQISHLNLDHATVIKLQKKRNCLFAFVRNTRNSILDNMELIGSPDRTSHKAKPKTKTREDVEKEIAVDEKTAQAEHQTKKHE
eukprot:gene15705-33176_t